ncbi:hypothetical protein F5146DRAFT_1132127 [Armillaria mellea]|nr:hypothetical protein F5146DRAFT_1132127 [Armillaria mellea]
MDHHREEHDDLLPPSGSNDDPAFPAAATWSETGHSSSPATLVESLSTAPQIRLGGTPAVVAGLLFGAALTAVLHHAYLSILRGRTVSAQFWIKNSSNALGTLVQWLCMGSVSVSLTQLIWYLLRSRPFTILQLNHLFGLPDPLRILRLASSRRLWNVIPIIIIATIFQAFALVSILAPNSLEVGSASPKNTTISVPTALFDKPIKGFPQTLEPPPADLTKVLRFALQSEKLVGWNAPAECGTACNYTIQYPAPALQCTELTIDEANIMLPIDKNAGAQTVYNATHRTLPASLLNESTLFGPADMSMAWWTYDTTGKSTIDGTRCSLYNTTQKSVVSFINNTGMISPSIISYDNPVNISWQEVGDELLSQAGVSVDAAFVSLWTYVLVGVWLVTQLTGSFVCYTPDGTVNGTLYSCSTSPDSDSEFDLTTNNLFSLNETAGTFTPKSANISSALEQILVNVTVALITYWGETTMVDASVAQDQLVWVYHVQRLWITYATALAVTAVCGAVGLVCILKNGEDRDLAFWDIVRATRNSELDAVVGGEKGGDVRKDTMLQYTVQGRDVEANTSGVFVLARPRLKGSN